MPLADIFHDSKIVEAIARSIRLSSTQGGRKVPVEGLPGINISCWGEVTDTSDVMNDAARAGKIEPCAYRIDWTRHTKGELEVPANPEMEA